MFKNFSLKLSFLLITTLLLLGCSSNPTSNLPVDDSNFSLKEDRLLGIDVNPTSNASFDESFTAGKQAGMQVIQLSLGWNDIEKTKNVFNNEFLGIANSYYSNSNVKIALNLNPIDTSVLRLPDYLVGKKLNDPEVIQAYKNLLDYSFNQIPNAEIVSLSVGNEVDVYLGNDSTKWLEFQDFFNQVKNHALIKKPSLKVGVKATFKGLMENSELKVLNSYSNVVMATYYPLNSDFTVKNNTVVKSDFLSLRQAYVGKEIYFLETGCPSSSINDSSEINQALFVREVFKAWDEGKTQIKLVNFVWLNDKSQEEVDAFANYYGIQDLKFKEYLKSLGLRTFEGRSKLSFEELKNQSKKRGFFRMFERN